MITDAKPQDLQLVSWRSESSWCFSLSLKAGKKINIPDLGSQTEGVPSFSVSLFYSGLQLIGWGPPALGEQSALLKLIHKLTITLPQGPGALSASSLSPLPLGSSQALVWSAFGLATVRPYVHLYPVTWGWAVSSGDTSVSHLWLSLKQQLEGGSFL